MKHIVSLLMLLVTYQAAWSGPLRSNAVVAELGGNGIVVSAQYSRIVLRQDRYFVSAQLGAGTVPFIGGISVPYQVTVNFGKDRSYLETGLGGTYWSGKTNASGYTETVVSSNISPLLGYRFHAQNGFLFRVYVNPLVNISGTPMIENYKIIPWLGLGLGYAF